MPSNTQQQIESSVQAFVSEITSLVRSAALDAVQSALGGTATVARRGPGRPKGSGAKAAPAARGGRRARRSSADVDAMANKFLSFVKAHDGMRLEEISKGLSIPTANLKLPAQKLLAAKSVRTTGAKRGTKYHAAGSGAGKKARAKKA